MNTPLPKWVPSDGKDGGGGPDKRPFSTPSQLRVDQWIRKQIDNTIEYKNKKKRWDATAKYELKHNKDLRWLKQVDFKLRKEQAKAEHAMLTERKAKAAAAAAK
jgi:hypothetical protein